MNCIPTSINFLGNINSDDFNEISIGTFQYTDDTHEGINKSYIYSYLNINDINQERSNVDLPIGFHLLQNYPNPFNAMTHIEYYVEHSGKVKIILYDIQGRIVQIIENGYKNAGFHKTTIDGDKLSSGIYFYQIITNEYSEIKKMTLIK